MQIAPGATLTFFPHADGEALLQPAVAALVPLVFVDAAQPLEAARVHVLLAHRASEESLVQTQGNRRQRTPTPARCQCQCQRQFIQRIIVKPLVR